VTQQLEREVDTVHTKLMWLTSANQVAEVRSTVKALVSHADPDTVVDAVLVADTVVTLAIRHGTRPTTIRLSLLNEGRALRVEASDHHPELRSMQDNRLAARVLTTLARDWDAGAHDKAIWADVSLT
jgi:anti-sigma regulatory factor (Ser/Thr protein kinase)